MEHVVKTHAIVCWPQAKFQRHLVLLNVIQPPLKGPMVWQCLPLPAELQAAASVVRCAWCSMINSLHQRSFVLCTSLDSFNDYRIFSNTRKATY
jgi:hypothetical protein